MRPGDDVDPMSLRKALRPAASTIRDALARVASSSPFARRLMHRASLEIERALAAASPPSAAATGATAADTSVATTRRRDSATAGERPGLTGGPAANPIGDQSSSLESRYGARYFGEGRDPSRREGLSGYPAGYDRVTSNADIAAYAMWRNFRASTAVDVGCSFGFVVEVLRELGIDAHGFDVSSYAISHAAPGAAHCVRHANLVEGLPVADASVELVCALETLEHLPPADVPRALAELRRICSGCIVATIPSFGPNAHGPDGWFNGKVLHSRLAYYESLGPSYDGPVPYDDLARDAEGEPVEGHLTIASFSWWTAQFERVGLSRLGGVERRFYKDIEPYGLIGAWNLYVFAVPGADENLTQPHDPSKSLAQLGLGHPLP